MLKRIISLLAALLLICSLPAFAFAASDRDLTLITDDEQAPAEAEISEAEVPEVNSGVSETVIYGQDGYTQAPASALPDWYPADVSGFQFFNDPNADRVVDRADIFSDMEEVAMRELIANVTAAAAKDVVIYTDTTSYGMAQNVLAADYYDFNGYGIGDGRDGIILFICMDPHDRGWQAVTTGSVQQIYTESAANQLDDRIYNFLVSGRYGEGVLDWINNIGTLYTKGIPFAPSWYTADGYAAPVSYDATRVSDEANLFTDIQRAELDASLREIRDTYGIDAVVHTSSTGYGMDNRSYAKAFFTMNGYGLGSNADGAALVLFSDGTSEMYVSGAAANKINSENTEKLLESVREKLSSSRDGFAAVQRWIKYLGKTLKTGRTPSSPEVWGRRGLIGSLVGTLSGAISLGKAKSGMKVVNEAVTAERNLVSDSLRVKSDDKLINVTVAQAYSPLNNNNGGGRPGGGGHSSFGGGFSGHSGSSHTSSGGRF